MRLSVWILGTEVWSVHFCASGCADEAETTTPGIGGGEGGTFERDTAPLDPADHYGEWEDRTRFGFGRRS